MYKVLITEFPDEQQYKDEEKAKLSDIAEVIVVQHPERSELLRLVEDVDVIMTDFGRIDREVFAHAKKLRHITVYGVGYDSVDVACATEHKVVVSNSPEVYTREVAEMAVTLTLAAAKFLCEAVAEVKTKALWHSAPFPCLKLYGKTLGVIGCGRIGSAFVQRMRGFEMRTLINDPYIPVEKIHNLGGEPADLQTLLAESDIISVHTPLNGETRGLLGEAQFAAMKPGVIVVNVSRGGIINDRALAKAMQEGKVLAAGVDVLEGEPNIAASPLLPLPRMNITPHIAWKSEVAAYGVEMQCVRNVRAFLVDNAPLYVVNPEVLGN